MKARIDRYSGEQLEKIVLTIFSGLFLTFSLYVYQAYNIHNGISATGHSLLFRALSFGVLTSFIFYINEFWLSPMIDWNINKMVWRVWELWFGGTMTFLLFNYFWNWQEMRWFSYFQLLLEYVGVIIIPIGLSYFAKIHFQNKYSNIETVKPSKPEKITFQSSNDKTKLTLFPNDFLYATSADNYVEIIYLVNQQTQKTLLRGTLKDLENQFPNLPFQRCHRSYFINTQNIQIVKKESQKMVVQLKDIDVIIPISKKYQTTFESYLN